MQRRLLLPLAGALVLAACSDGSRNPLAPAPDGPIAYAAGGGGGGNPHFIKNATSVARSGDDLTVVFKESGLAEGSVETVQLSAIGTATYKCINGGGHNPSAANKRTISTLETTSGQFTADANGNIVGSLSLAPPGPGDFTCPPGQTLTGPLDVSYTSVSLTDLTSGATMSFGGTF